MTEGTGERVGSYRIVRRLAVGGTSEVLLAKADGPLGFERTVVLKLLLSQYTNDPEVKAMFAREAAAYARLSHPSIVRLYDFFQHGSQLVMVLEYIDGPALSRLRGMLKAVNQPIDDQASFYIGGCIFDALAAAHAASDDTAAPAAVIHRDVNPTNVLIAWDAHVKLADFGVAKLTGLSHQSTAGLVKGTYGYMAPEQVRGETVTPRADVYAGGIVLWELLTKRRAFIRGALPDIEVLRELAEPKIMSIDVVRPDVDKSVRDAIKRALEPRAEKRTMTAEEMVSILRAVTPSDEGRERLVRALSLVRHEPKPSPTSMPPPHAPSPSSPAVAPSGSSGARGMLPARPAGLPRPTPAPRPATTPSRKTAPYGQTANDASPLPPRFGSSPRLPAAPPVLGPPRPRTQSQEIPATLGAKDLERPRSAPPSSEPGLASVLEPSRPGAPQPSSQGGPAAAKVSLFDSLVEPPELVQTTGRDSEKLRLGTPLGAFSPRRMNEAIDDILQNVPSNVPPDVFPKTDPPREIGQLPAAPPPLNPVAADLRSTLLAGGRAGGAAPPPSSEGIPSSFPAMNKTLAMYERVDVRNPTADELANAEKMTARPPPPVAMDVRTAPMPAVEPPDLLSSTAKMRGFVVPNDAKGSMPPPGAPGVSGSPAPAFSSAPPETLPLGGMTIRQVPPIAPPPMFGPPPGSGQSPPHSSQTAQSMLGQAAAALHHQQTTRAIATGSHAAVGPPGSRPPMMQHISAAPGPASTRPPARRGVSALALVAMLLIVIASGVAGTVAYVRWQRAKAGAGISPAPVHSAPVGATTGAGSAVGTSTGASTATAQGTGAATASAALAVATADAAPPRGDGGAVANSAPEAAVKDAAATKTADDVPAGMGRVKTEGSVAGRRIFVDERTVGQTPESVVVKCGSRTIKLGSSGFPRIIDVPCGGEILVGDR